MSIKGFCHSNIGWAKQTEWPREFVAVPRIGEYVESTCGQRELKVIRVIHRQRPQVDEEPYITIELNK